MSVTQDATLFKLRDHFLGWQCRIRQHAVRNEGGRPPDGARPAVHAPDGSLLADAVTLLIVRRDSEDDTAAFRHIVSRTHDPAERFKKAMEKLAEAYYQQARAFSDTMGGLFRADAPLVAELRAAGRCRLVFGQFSQRYDLACDVSVAGKDDPLWQAVYWHSAMFNPAIPGDIAVLGFTPRWVDSQADPPPR